MPEHLSIIIPTLNAEAELRANIAELHEELDGGLVGDLIISDGGSSDATRPLAEQLGATVLTGNPGRGIQLRRGAEQATGDWYLFLHADSHLEPGWRAQVARHIENRPDRAAVFRLAFRSRHVMARLVAGWANFRTRVLGLPFGDQGLLISAALYREIGGYPEMPLMEDVAIARKLGGRISVLASRARTSATRYEREGWLWRGTKNLWLLGRYLCGTSPERLARFYR